MERTAKVGRVEPSIINLFKNLDEVVGRVDHHACFALAELVPSQAS
jgi:hypothetical protein